MRVVLALHSAIHDTSPQDPGYQDELCHWLDEAVSKTPKPSNWEADTVQDMGVFVITGTPGIGKFVFLAYVASRLAEEGINIVIQLGKRWWSRISGQTITHNDTWPVKLLDDSKTVLLADPVGGENSQPVDPRIRGCTIIFTSPQQKNYDSVWKQAEGRSKRYFMPVWSEEEVLNHWKAGGILQICKEEADVKKAYSMIGGSVRYLHKLLVAVAENKTTLEEEAKQMIRDCVVKCTFEDLCQAADCGGADMDAQNNRSKMSRVLHIHSDAKFQTPNVKLIESEVCKSKKVELVCTALKTNKDKTVAILHSGKLRAVQTAEALGAALKASAWEVLCEERPGLQPKDEPSKAMELLPSAPVVVLVGHLPHLGHFAASLLQNPAAAGRLQGLFHPASGLALKATEGVWAEDQELRCEPGRRSLRRL
ncbi:unnamed protein product [Effrenium voratum]|nr:unnamed protein product [Effrenium voratum]